MGIFLSFLFPRQYMFADRSRSSASSSSSRSSSPRPDIALSTVSHTPPSPSTDPAPSPGPSPSPLGSPPLDSHPYSPHAVGIGILSPQPILPPFSSLTRVSLPPLQHNISPQRSSSYELPVLCNSDSPGSHAITLSEDPEVPPHASLSAATSAAGLRIAIPLPNPTSSTSTPSPPLFPTSEALASSHLPSFDIASPSNVGPNVAFPGADLALPPTDLDVDFTEFDSEGLSALEKIYLFSRSRAGFHRVFIAHALPRYLGSEGESDARYPSREQSEQISPGEAVQYVLPLLNGLAMDDDESVKEALAAELVPIVWWFITHCRLVEDDHVSPHAFALTSSPSAGPGEGPAFSFLSESTADVHETVISVQAFTPILGTLLLSQNALVGGPARYAVVELLRRVRRADKREEGAISGQSATSPSTSQTTQEPQTRRRGPSPEEEEFVQVGLLGHHERYLFEHEIVHQVVIGMGRLDMPDDSSQGEGEPYPSPGSQSAASPGGTSTAVPTPTAGVQSAAGQQTDSYFPMLTSPLNLPSSALDAGPLPAQLSPAPASALATPPAAAFAHAQSPQPSPVLLPSLSLLPSPGPSPAFPLSPPSPLPQSLSDPTSESSSSSSSSLGTPSLTSSTSSSTSTSSSPTPDLPAFAIEQLDTSLPGRVDEVDVEMADEREEKWVPQSPRPAHALSQAASMAPSTGTGEAASPVSAAIEQLMPVPAWLTSTQRDIDVNMRDATAPEEGVGEDHLDVDEGERGAEGNLSEEAAVGRLSSMSLMAAVTASGSIGDDTKAAFVAEVERVGRDPVYWVRREATFAVGALAKVVPGEVVMSSLLPLFELLCQDPTWHVRHSVLFALPAILSRLPLRRRRALALDVILPLSTDEEPTVRSAVLEALGEVMHTFADTDDGPPSELLNLFLGVRDWDTNRRQSMDTRSPPSSARPPGSGPSSESGWSDYSGTESNTDADIYDDPSRPLVCAFNYPAVALTLGRARWSELRGLYLSLALNASFKVRRTLAASLGELAKIVGPEYAKEDLMGVWWRSLRSEEGEVRLKAIECAEVFVRAIGEAERVEVLRGLEQEFAAGKLRGWREREEVIKTLGGILEISGLEKPALRRLLMMGMGDNVAAIREAAVSAVPAFVKAWRSRPDLLDGLLGDIRALARSDSYRKRSIFVVCEQALLPDCRDIVLADEGFWSAVSALVQDRIVDVRIRVARLLTVISDNYAHSDRSIIARLHMHAQRLEQDTSHEVRAFAHFIRAPGVRIASSTLASATRSSSTFSRPPPPAPS
ncbi:hypothetical protein AcV5_006128 [Taiwanofungus camphoratus]|nr:hypothetical protein AcV5_006128 [Antrodia cinnamomea]